MNLGKKTSHLELVCGRNTSYKFLKETKKRNHSCTMNTLHERPTCHWNVGPTGHSNAGPTWHCRNTTSAANKQRPQVAHARSRPATSRPHHLLLATSLAGDPTYCLAGDPTAASLANLARPPEAHRAGAEGFRCGSGSGSPSSPASGLSVNGQERWGRLPARHRLPESICPASPSAPSAIPHVSQRWAEATIVIPLSICNIWSNWIH